MNRQFLVSDSRWRPPTNKSVWQNYSPHQKKFTGHMLNIKLEEKSKKMIFKSLLVKTQWSKNRQWGTLCCPSLPAGTDRVKRLGLRRKSETNQIYNRCYLNMQSPETYPKFPYKSLALSKKSLVLFLFRFLVLYSLRVPSENLF